MRGNSTQIGINAGSKGTLNVNGVTLTSTLTIGQCGEGILKVTNGGVVQPAFTGAGYLQAGLNPGSIGRVTVENN